MNPQPENPLSFGQRAEKPKPELLDPKIEADITSFIEAVLEEEKKEFQPGVESFAVHSNRIRQEISDAMHTFQKKYSSGFQTVCEVLKAQGIARPELDKEHQAIFDDPLEFSKALENGQSIHQMLGFSSEQLTKFYEIGTKLAEENDFAKARDVFYFLATIGPDISAFWLGLGMCSARLQNYEASRDAFRCAIELTPQNADAYLGCIHANVLIGARDEAITLCDEGLTLALANQGQPWAEALGSSLEDAKQFVLHA